MEEQLGIEFHAREMTNPLTCATDGTVGSSQSFLRRPERDRRCVRAIYPFTQSGTMPLPQDRACYGQP